MAKPPITIKCECGESREVAYGERWTCERCRRSWNTAQIPADEYAGLLRTMRLRKLEAIGVATAIAVILVPLVIANAAFIFVVPVVAAAWLFLYLPRWRRRVRAAAHSAPHWELHPE